MATLVLSTVGTALGGPVGSAIGALIGQSIDRELLTPARRGPRIGDLSVQTSSYGTQIPRIYGNMRVAGSVVWSTDLVEHPSAGGAKGQPDVAYSYSVSMAIALSSRPVKSIGRIWADGKLVRGAAGNLKVGGTLRLHAGDEDQNIDPFIGSAEGIANTPAYRGLALAVFESLELSEFGNRIPFLTFEVEADDQTPLLGAVLSDAASGAIASDARQELTGYAAYGPSIRSAIEPLVESFGVELFDDGTKLRSPSGNVLSDIGEDELGSSADDRRAPRLEREQLPASSTPAQLRLTYYEPARDYQTGEVRAVCGELAGVEARQDLPVVLNASDAKALAQLVLARSWSRRDKLNLRLPPGRLSVEPGYKLELPLSPGRWTVEKVTVDGFVVVAELRPTPNGAVAVPADAGRIVQNNDVPTGTVTLALLDVPNLLAGSEPAVLLAASTPTKGWKPRTVELGLGEQFIRAQTARNKSRLGQALTVLQAGESDLIDDRSSVDVELIDADQWLTSADDDSLVAGENVALLGKEIIQFGRATPLGSGRFRLSHLLRGRGGTEWASASHGNADVFCVIEPGALQPVTMPKWALGAQIKATIAGGTGQSIQFGAEALRPPSPVNLIATKEPVGDLVVKWTRRSRDGFAWVDEIDAPVGEAREQYRVSIAGTTGSNEQLIAETILSLAAADVAAIGAGPAVIEVRQIGDFAASRPARITIDLS